MSSPSRPLMLPTCPLLYLDKYYLLLSYQSITTSKAITKPRMEQVLEKDLSFQLQGSP